MKWLTTHSGLKVWDGDLWPDDPRHGTRAGALAHRRRGHKPCLPCAAAASEYASNKAKRNRCLGCGKRVRGTRCAKCANTRRTCKRGHRRTPSNLNRWGECIACKKARAQRKADR